MAVKLYLEKELSEVAGLYSIRALSKMNGDLEVYSTLLDKLLNQAPRSIPRLKQFLKEKKMTQFIDEMKNVRIDLADVFASDMLERANKVFDTAESGDLAKLEAMMETFLSNLQTLCFDIKQCRTQEMLQNEDEAAAKAAEIDIGSAMINNKYATVPKGKFVELYKRIDTGVLDKAMNLANVLKAMGFEASLHKHIVEIITQLNQFKQTAALAEARKLLALLNCPIPAAAPRLFTVLVVDDAGLTDTVKQALGDNTTVINSHMGTDTLQIVQSDKRPDFILINEQLKGTDGHQVLDHLVRNRVVDIPIGFVFPMATSDGVLKARKNGACEFFLLPLDSSLFAAKLAKYRAVAPI